MTVGTIEVFKLPASLVTGDYPVFSSPSAALSSYLTTSFSNAKFTKDFQQRIVIAEFDGWQSANMVRLTSGSWVAWYWITDRSAQTGINSAIEYAIEYNPVSSLLTSSSSVTGYWTRTPTNISPWKQQAVMSGAMIPDKIQNFNNSIASFDGTSYRIFWVQVTATVSLEYGNTDRLTNYGFPVACRQDSDGTFKLSNQYIYTQDDNTSHVLRFPSLAGFINDVTQFGLADSTVITDISISPILPFEYRFTTIDGSQYFQLYNTNTSEWRAPGHYDASTYVAAYELTNPYQNRIWDSQSLGISALQASCGNVTITTPDGSDIAQIPIQWFTQSGSIYSLGFSVQCLPDYGQMTIRIDIGDRSYQMPTAHLPYIGNQWQTYIAYSQAFDREALESNIGYARDALNIQTNSAIANGVLGAIGSVASGNIGGAVSSLAGLGISTATSYRLQDISDRQARYNQDLTERRIQAQPANVYNTNYGITYIENCLNRLPGFVVSIPAGLTDDIFNTYVERYGYSAEGKATLTIDTGYYQGQILPTTTISGGEYDRLNETFMRGIHITEV